MRRSKAASTVVAELLTWFGSLGGDQGEGYVTREGLRGSRACGGWAGGPGGWSLKVGHPTRRAPCGTRAKGHGRIPYRGRRTTPSPASTQARR